ncbi:MAG: hypothetical protein H0W14_06075, partial [Actinobacteria bacterium]|nr:hypothetical protein [Actinomycetota bacterium]
AAYLASTTGPRDVLLGYDPLFLQAWERRRETPAGLAAFEEAPCYRELVESERAAP